MIWVWKFSCCLLRSSFYILAASTLVSKVWPILVQKRCWAMSFWKTTNCSQFESGWLLGNCPAYTHLHLVQDAIVDSWSRDVEKGMQSMGVLRNAFSHGASRLITPNAALSHSHSYPLLHLQNKSFCDCLDHWPWFMRVEGSIVRAVFWSSKYCVSFLFWQKWLILLISSVRFDFPIITNNHPPSRVLTDPWKVLPFRVSLATHS